MLKWEVSTQTDHVRILSSDEDASLSAFQTPGGEAQAPTVHDLVAELHEK